MLWSCGLGAKTWSVARCSFSSSTWARACSKISFLTTCLATIFFSASAEACLSRSWKCFLFSLALAASRPLTSALVETRSTPSLLVLRSKAVGGTTLARVKSSTSVPPSSMYTSSGGIHTCWVATGYQRSDEATRLDPAWKDASSPSSLSASPSLA